MKVKSLSHVLLFATPWTVAYQAPPSMGFSRQEYWSGWSLPSPANKAGTSILDNTDLPPIQAAASRGAEFPGALALLYMAFPGPWDLVRRPVTMRACIIL